MTMKLTRPLLLALCAVASWSLTAADPVPPQIQNLVAAQRPGTFLVDITYDLVDPDSLSLFVLVECSADGGNSYNIPVSAASGDIGIVAPGAGKRIVWNVWESWAGNYTTNARVRLVADDTASLVVQPPTAPPATNLVWVPSGSFVMNPPNGPKVWLTQGFWMSKFEVTQGEYQAVMGSNPSSFRGSTLPVETVSWTNAVEYCAALTTRERTAGRLPTGWSYRLPTEAEWEYACRAGTTTAYSFGDYSTSMAFYAWYNINSNNKTHEVGTRGPNRWGLFDMHGNVYEWCADRYGTLPGGNLTDPKGPVSGSTRVMRGGSLDHEAGYCASSYRHYTDPSSPALYLGFRVVLAPGQ